MEWNEELQTVVPSKFKLSPFSVLNLPTTLRRLSHRFHHLNNHRSPLLLTRALSSSATAAVAPQPSATASQDENKGVKASQWKAVIDFKWIRDNKEAVAANIKNRYSNANLELVIELYDKLMSVQKSSWSKVVVRKWLNIKSGGDEFHSDYRTNALFQRRRKSCSDDGGYFVVPEELSEKWLMEKSNGIERPGFNQLAPLTPSNLRMFVGTWNVGGKSPLDDEHNLKDWLRTKAPADIYVLGFQEIVPLNAGNVLGPEDCGPADRWLSLIGEALNEKAESSSPNHECPFSRPRVSSLDLLSLEDIDDDHLVQRKDYEKFSNLASNSKQRNYCLAASKQMVGVFLCVWVRDDLIRHISSLKVSCVGRGIMEYLGNKGSITISMILHESTFCFVCTHLASGERDGATARRNLDVTEILKRTRFSHPFGIPGKPIPPDTILDHDNIIWLGDLNYRLVSGCGDTSALFERNDWQALLEKDELRIEQKAGRVFKGWEEGEIYFAPTYKYITNSDRYVVQTSTNSKQKSRTPAWCDRILWKGEGVEQLWYVRGESSTFSDHRPVSSLFSVQLHLPNYPCPTSRITLKTPSSTTEELLVEPIVASKVLQHIAHHTGGSVSALDPTRA